MVDLRQNRLSTWLSIIAVLISVAALFHQVQIADDARRLQVAQKRTELLSRMGVLVAKLEDLEGDIGRIKTVAREALNKSTDPMVRRALELTGERAEQMEVACLGMVQKLSESYRDGEGLSGDVEPEELERAAPLLRETEIRVDELTKSVREIEDATWELIDISVD